MLFRNPRAGTALQFACAFVIGIIAGGCSKSDLPVPTIPKTKFYRLRGPELWGDYGNVLIHGFAGGLDGQEGILEIERTGPFVPPITLPMPGSQNLVITDEFRKELESGDLGQLRFRPVIKARIVDIPWQDWNLDAEEPQEGPETGEPDDYLDRPHSPEIAEAIGDLWQIILNDGAEVDIDIKRAPWDYDVRVHVDTWNGEPLFFGKHPKADSDRGRWIIVTDRGKRWLEEKAGKWVRFQELPVK